MNAAEQPQGDDLLAGWAERQEHGSRRRARPREQARLGLRFAFYGRISTEDFQDRLSSQRWQKAVAEDVVAGHGTIVAEFFDVGYSRRLPWAERPQASALLATLPRSRYAALTDITSVDDDEAHLSLAAAEHRRHETGQARRR